MAVADVPGERAPLARSSRGLCLLHTRGGPTRTLSIWHCRSARWPNVSVAPVWAALTLGVYWACGVVPVQLATAAALGLTPGQSEAFLFGIWSLGGLSSMICALAYRQPIVVSMSFSALLYMGTLAGHFSIDELVGASVMAAAILTTLGLCGATTRVMAVLPPSLVMGTFAGTIFAAASRLVTTTVDDGSIAGVTVVGYVLGRTVNRACIPPVGMAATFGGVAVALTQPVAVPALEWGVPALAPIEPRFTIGALLGVSLPVALMAVGLGHVRSAAFLRTQGYRVPLDRVTAGTGLASVVTALVGGAPLSIGAEPSAILGGPDAGPPRSRYVGAVITAVAMLAIALMAPSLAELFGALPGSYLVALLGVALLAPLRGAVATAFEGSLGFGGLVAFIVAATPFSIAGLPSPIWALAAGLVASAATEPEALLASCARVSGITRPDGQPVR